MNFISYIIALSIWLIAIGFADAQYRAKKPMYSVNLKCPKIYDNKKYVFRVGQYKVNKLKLIGLGALAIAAAADGSSVAFEFDGRHSFERKYGVDPHSFLGSMSWENLYTDPNWWNTNMGTFDYHHVTDDIRKIGYIGGGITFGIGAYKVNTHWTHYLIDAGAILLTTWAFKQAAHDWTRR